VNDKISFFFVAEKNSIVYDDYISKGLSSSLCGIYTPKDTERIYIYKFSKAFSMKRGQEEICLKYKIILIFIKLLL
jgi:hypothetical protein